MSSKIHHTRRRALQGLGLLALAPTWSAQAKAGDSTPAPAMRLATDSGLEKERATGEAALQRFLRMRTSPDGAPVLWVYAGVLVVKPEGEVARSVAKIQGLSRTQATQQPDGRWLWTLDEAGYYCDPVSGAVADRLYNPFTQTQVRPKHYRSPQRLLFSTDGIQPAMSLPADVEFRGEITELAHLAGTVAMTEDLYVKIPARSSREGQAAQPARLAASLATFTTRESQLDSAPSQWVDCQFNYTTLNSFVGWLGMSDRGGVQDMRLVGIKVRLDDSRSIPALLRQRILDEHRDLLV